MTIAPKFSPRFSYRVAILRNCFNLAKRRSTRLRVRYTPWSKAPLWRSLFLCGMVTAMPCFRRYERNLRLLYPLSATKRFGYLRLRPVDFRSTEPCSNKVSAIVMSCCCPGVRAKVSNRPFPPARTCSLVPKPPRLRPNASASGVLFLPPLHVDWHELSSHLRNGVPSSVRLVDLPTSVSRLTRASTPRVSASVEIDCTRLSICRIARASLARALQFARSTRCRSALCDVRAPVDRFAASAAVAVARSFPIVRSLVRLDTPCPKV